MKRSPLILTAILTASFGLSVPVFAAPPAPNSSASDSPAAQSPALKDFKLPSDADINQMLENMPDFNGIMADVMDVMKDENLQSRMKASAEGFKDIIEKSDVFENRSANGMPDINALMATMLGAMSQDGPAGDLLLGLTEMATEFDAIAEKHDLKPKSTTP